MDIEMKPKHLVMVTASANNNKYYNMIPQGDSWIAEYGRVGSSSQRREYSMNQWDKKYQEKIKKGYVDQSDLVEDLIHITKSNKKEVSYKEIENKVIAGIVERLQQMARKAISDNYTISSNKVTQAMIEEAQNVLSKLIAANDTKRFNNILIELFSVIPRKMGNVSAYLAEKKEDYSKIVQREQDLLDVMKGQVVQKQVENVAVKENTQEQITILEAMGLEVEECDDSDIVKIKNELGSCSNKFHSAWRVKNLKTSQRFDDFIKNENIEDTKLLWHGSRNENWWSIINTGLVLRPTNAVITGKMFGIGTYFATKAQKSLGYTSLDGSYWANGNSSSAFMALMEVAYGKPYDVYSFDSKYYDYDYKKLQQASPGANCLHAHAGSMLRNDEIVVYKEEQSTIRYLVELK